MATFDQTKMLEATRLTRDGRLAEAMAILKSAMHAGAVQSASKPNTDDAVELRMRALESAPSTAPQSTADARHSRVPQQPKRAGAFERAAALARSHLTRSFNAPGAPKGELAPRSLPDGARFEQRSFSNDAGTRSYKVYVPAGFKGQALPLVVMLHGCTQSADDFAAGTRMNELAEETGFFVAYPEQGRSANASKCWNWFNVADQRRDSGEPSLIAGITRQITHDFPVVKDRVYLAGLSAGGAAAAIMGSAYPDVYAAIAVHSGLACGAASDMTSALTAMRQGASAISRPDRRQRSTVPTLVFHGDRDSTVSPANGDQVIEASLAEMTLRETVTSGTSSGGVSYTRTCYSDDAGRTVHEKWAVHGVGHAWSGGSAAGTYTEPRGPDASREMLRFFSQHTLVRH